MAALSETGSRKLVPDMASMRMRAAVALGVAGVKAAISSCTMRKSAEILKNARRLRERPHIGRRRNAERLICRQNDIWPRRRNIEGVAWGLFWRLRRTRGLRKRVFGHLLRRRDCAFLGHEISPKARRERTPQSRCRSENARYPGANATRNGDSAGLPLRGYDRNPHRHHA